MQSVIMEGMVAGHQRGWSAVSARAMLPLLGRPLIEWVIEELHKAGVSIVSIAANGFAEKLHDTLQDTSLPEGVQLSFSRETTPRGPAGSVRSAYDFAKGGSVLAIEGGLFVSGGLAELVEIHERSSAALTIALKENSGKHTPGGVYVLSQQAVESIPESGYVDIKEQLIPLLIRAGLSVRGHVFSGHLYKIFKAADHLGLARKILCGELGTFPDGTSGHTAGQPLIADSARVEPGASVVGPVFVDHGAVIREGAKVIGPALIGKGCVVGRGAVVCECVVEDGCVVESGARAVGRIVQSHLHRGLWSRLRDWFGARPIESRSAQPDMAEPADTSDIRIADLEE